MIKTLQLFLYCFFAIILERVAIRCNVFAALPNKVFAGGFRGVVFFLKRAPLIFLYICLHFALTTSNLFAAVYVDDLNRSVEIKQNPKRIISLAPSVTETLFALDLSEQIVGVTRFCNFPPPALKKEKVGGFTNPNIEAIIALAPDLIVATYDGNDKSKVEKLTSLGFPVYLQRADNLATTYASIEKLGIAVGKANIAQELVKVMRKKEQLLKQRIADKKPKKIFFEIGSSLWSFSNKTFIGDLIRRAKGINIVGEMSTRYAKINLEVVIAREPEVIIISSMANPEKLPALKQAWQKWSTIPAVKNDQVYVIQSDIVNRAGPRIVDALEQLINIIHFTD